MSENEIEVYLSKDILQGEEVPFYILWKRDDLKEIKVELNGFSGIVEYHNVRNNFSNENKTIKTNDLKCKYYFGGILKTEITNNPFQNAYLKIIFSFTNGDKIEKIQKRILYHTNLEIAASPKHIKVPIIEPSIEIQLRGTTTVFIGIFTTEDSDLYLEFPKEIKNAMEKFYQSFMDGLKTLIDEYPEYESFNKLLNPSILSSPREIYDDLIKEIEIKKPDESFSEAIAMVFINSLLSHGSIKDAFINPLIEYFESSAGDKAYLMSPFLNVNVPKNGGRLKLKIFCINIFEKQNIVKHEKIIDTFLDKNSINSVFLEMFIKSDNDILIPIKDLIKIKRVK